MTYSFIHLSDIEQNNFTLYQVNDDKSINSLNINFNNLQEHLDKNSTCIIFLSSKYFNFKSFKNELNLKNEHLKATILNEVEDSIISNISELDFKYASDLELGAWIDKSLINNLNQRYNLLPANIIILPEHFLLGNKQNRILLNADYFCVALQDSSGFSGASKSLKQFIDFTSEDIDIGSIEIISFEKNIQSPEWLDKKLLHVEPSLLYVEFIERLDSISMNFFKRSFSYNFFKSQVNFNTFDKTALILSALIIMLSPLISSSFLKSYSNSYKAMTLEVFQQLNPSFNRIVNPKAQIIDLTRDLPEQESVNFQNLDMLNYINQINDEAIKKVEINLIDQQIILQIDNLSSIKYKIFQKLFLQPSLNINSSGLINTNDSYSGSLIINYVP